MQVFYGITKKSARIQIAVVILFRGNTILSRNIVIKRNVSDIVQSCVNVDFIETR